MGAASNPVEGSTLTNVSEVRKKLKPGKPDSEEKKEARTQINVALRILIPIFINWQEVKMSIF